MATVANSFITALGLLGAMALIRFRNLLKDTRDIAFVFGTLVAGMSSGAQRYGTAVVGTLFVCLCAVYLYLANFGSHEPHNAFLQLRLRKDKDLERDVGSVLRRFARSYTVVSARREQGSEESSYALHVFLSARESTATFVGELERVPGVGEVALTMQEELLEV
jgi:uncharacterized membrane protein YhiD involved in acid resistance